MRAWTKRQGKLYNMHVDLIPTRRGILDEHDLGFWLRWINEYSDEQIYLIDRELCRTPDEIPEFGLSALPRLEMARIMRVPELNLTGRKSIDPHAPTAYALKHRFERWIQLEESRPYYVSELQAAVVMQILGYRTTWEKPRRYNVSMRAYSKFCATIRATELCKG